MTEKVEEKYVLSHGCHKGTLISRDYGRPEEFDTFEEAHKAYVKHRNFYRSIGYMIWFAHITAPDGTKTHLESNPYY